MKMTFSRASTKYHRWPLWQRLLDFNVSIELAHSTIGVSVCSLRALGFGFYVEVTGTKCLTISFKQPFASCDYDIEVSRR